MISPKTYFLNADRTKVVPEGDKTAQFLLVREGHEIPDALAKQWGLTVDGSEEQPDKAAAAHDPEKAKGKAKH